MREARASPDAGTTFTEDGSMNPMIPSVATLAVSTIYMVWYEYQRFQARRRVHLRERVTYMLWVMANGPESGAPV